ncbi:MAG: HK97 family phage prohead protease [Anaerolineae bacterium]|nr:HK97 family phage prohead protease [Anaerolineae bacterium]
MNTTIKMLDEPAGRVGGYLVVWGSPDRRDLQGEYFAPDTELGLDWYSQRPMLYHHGLDGTMKAEVIGVIDTLRPDDTGIWAEAQLDLRKRYVQTVQQLIHKGALGWSSGSLPHLVEVADDGQIKRWPIVEGSATPTPAEPRKTDIHTIKSAYLELGLDPTLLGLAETAPPPDEPVIPPEEPVAKEVETAGVVAPAVSIPLPPATQPTVPTEPIRAETPTETPIEETMNLRDILNGLLSVMMQAMPDFKPSEEQINTILTAAEQQLTPQQEAIAAMPPDQIAQTAAPIVGKALTEFVTAQRQAAEQTQQAIQAAALKYMQNAAPISRAGGGFSGQGMGSTNSEGNGQGGAPAHIRNLKLRGQYANLSPETMSFIADTYTQYQRKLTGERFLPGGDADGVVTFMQELADKSAPLYESGRLYLPDTAAKAMKSIIGAKANELDHTTQANYGQEWVQTLWRDQIWDKARLENVVLSQFESLEMAAKFEELPLEKDDPEVSFVAEDTDDAHLDLSGSNTPASRLGTGKETFSAKKLALRVGWSAEENEDSIIRFAEQARKQADRAMRNAIDHILLNGDTETGTTNINKDGAAPGAKDKYLAFNGLLKMALVTGTGLKVDAGNAGPSLAAVRQTRFKMGREQAPNVDEILLFAHTESYSPLLGLDEFLTMDKVGNQATALRGQLGMIDGMPVLVTAQLLLSAANGKVSNTPGNNLRGRYVVVYKPNWKVGFRRKITANLFPTQTGEAWQLYMSTRLDFKSSTQDSVATLYNLAV